MASYSLILSCSRSVHIHFPILPDVYNSVGDIASLYTEQNPHNTLTRETYFIIL
jgi:hypothetical protein